MKSFLCLALFCFGCHGLLAQHSVSDSLTARLAQPMPDTARVLLLNQLGRALMYANPNQALSYAQEGLQLAREADFKRGEARLLNCKGITLRLMGRFDKALEAHLAAAQVAGAIHDTEVLARSYNGLGIVYSERKESRKAIAYFQKTRALAGQLADNDLKRLALSNIGSDYALLNQLDSALTYTRAAYDLTRQLNAADAQIELINLGNIYKRMGKNDLALRYYRQSIPTSVAVENNRDLSQTYLEMAEVFHSLNQTDSAIGHAEKALRIAQTAKLPANVLTASTLLATLYELTNARQVVTYLKLAAAAKDSLENVGKIRAFQQIEFGETLREQDIRQAEAMYRSRLMQYLLLGGLAILGLVAGLQYRNNRQKQRVNVLLEQQHDEINHQRNKAEQALADLTITQAQLIQKEKLASLGELTAGIAHELQNPLNFVNNFSDVSVELIDELTDELGRGDPDGAIAVANEIRQSLQRIVQHGKRASNIVSGMLEHARFDTGERQPTNVNVLTDEFLRLAYQSQRVKDPQFECHLDTHFEPNLPLVDVAAQDISRVLLNLFNNAFYAVQQQAKQGEAGYKPTLTISTRLLESNPSTRPERATLPAQSTGLGVEIRVADNGTGMSEAIKAKVFQPFFTTKPTGEGTGLGLSLSYDIITKGHNGTLSVESEPSLGTAFLIRLLV